MSEFEDGDIDLDTGKIWFQGKWRTKGAYAAAKSRAKKMALDPKYLEKESAKRRENRRKRTERLRELEEKERKAKTTTMATSKDISETRARMRGEGKRSASESTVELYKKRCAGLAREMGVKNFNPDKPTIFKKHKKVIDFIMKKSKNANTRHFYLSCIKSILQYRKGYEKAFEAYAKAWSDIENPYLQRVGENVLLPHEKDIVEWADLTRDVKRALPNVSPRDAVISSLYTMFPPRRADYAIMKISENGAKTDPRYNYLIVSDKGDVEAFVFNKFKTAKTFGQQVFPIKGKLAHILEEYITEMEKGEGDFLFTTSEGKPLKRGSFIKLIPIVFERITGTQMSINDLRKSCVSYYLNKKISMNKRRELGDKMAHSINTQLIYHKTDLD